MSIYSCNISNVSRAAGSSSCATLSYISGEKVREDRTGELYQYGRDERVVLVETMLPKNAPKEYQDPAKLFNAIETYEKADNARTAKKIMVALPREFDLDTQRTVLEDYIRANITEQGYACTYAIHTDKENHNPHAHILIANRPLNEKGEWSAKSRKEYALDEHGNRIPLIDPKTGEQKVDSRNRKQWKRVAVQANLLDKKETLQRFRENWAVECNKHLTPDLQIDHRSLAEQGREEEPTIHEGYAARKMEERGEVSERCELNREIRERNRLLQQIRKALEEVWAQLNRLLQERLMASDPAYRDAKELYRLSQTFIEIKMRSEEIHSQITPVDTRSILLQVQEIEEVYQYAEKTEKTIKQLKEQLSGLSWFQVRQKKELQNSIEEWTAVQQQKLTRLKKLGVPDLNQAPTIIAQKKAMIKQGEENTNESWMAYQKVESAWVALCKKAEKIPTKRRERTCELLKQMKQSQPALEGESPKMKLHRAKAEDMARKAVESHLKPRMEHNIKRKRGHDITL